LPRPANKPADGKLQARTPERCEKGFTMGSDQVKPPMVRIAELEIEPDQLAQYSALLAKGVEAAVRLEPGVLMLYAMAIEGEPTHLRIIEVYADEAAYLAHLQAPHFLAYKAATVTMVRSLKLIDTVPVSLSAKAQMPQFTAT
jgi:quinol monooxygenase YgiN